MTSHGSARVEIIEEPLSKAMRFRYECERRTNAIIYGANSTVDKKTYPTIRIIGYTGEALVIVSCVTAEEPYKVHPHRLMSKNQEKTGSGAYSKSLVIRTADEKVEFRDLGIQCVKRSDFKASLAERERFKIDPFNHGFDHKHNPREININAIRLCFQVITGYKSKDRKALKPVLSTPIYDRKANIELTIFDISALTSPVSGGKKIMLFCDKVNKGNIAVRLYETDVNGIIVWKTLVDSSDKTFMVHRQTGISFKTPMYRNQDVEEPVKVFLQLYRPSDEATSEAKPFEYIPLETSIQMRRKKKKCLTEDTKRIWDYLDVQERKAEANCEYNLNIPLIQDVRSNTDNRSDRTVLERQALHTTNRNHTFSFNRQQELPPQPQYQYNVPKVFQPTHSNYGQYNAMEYMPNMRSYSHYDSMEMQGAVGGCARENAENILPQYHPNNPYLNSGACYQPMQQQSYNIPDCQSMTIPQLNYQQVSTASQPVFKTETPLIGEGASTIDSKVLDTNELCEALIDIDDLPSNIQSMVVKNSTNNFTNNFGFM